MQQPAKRRKIESPDVALCNLSPKFGHEKQSLAFRIDKGARLREFVFTGGEPRDLRSGRIKLAR